VVEDVEDPAREIGLKDAQAIKKSVAVGDELASPEPLPHNASRIAAQTAKQVVLQRLREAERERLYEEFIQHKDDIVSGVVEQIESGRTVTMDLGRAQAVMPPDEQVPTERYRKGQRVKVYVLDVRNSPKGPEILVSRSHKNLLKRLFEIEVPEVYNGVVEIKAIAREAGFRSKVAVYSSQEGIDPVGSCIGIRGNRIQSIVNELQGEKIDVVPWDRDPKVFIGKALSPSEVVHVALNSDDQTAIVVVPDRQLSLAIGREGQNARLAARLAGWRLDIKGLTEWEAIKEEQQKKLEEERRLAAEAKAQQAAQEATAAEAVAEEETAEPEIEPAPVAEAVEVAIEQAQPEAEPVLATAETETIAADEVDEDALLEALLREEAAEQEPAAEEAEAVTGLSVEELASFTLEDVEEEDYEEEEAEEGEVFQPEMPVLTPDAGKIRFAEDIVGDYRGGGRRDRKSRRGTGNRGGARRGPGR
jgi:N utilization substance protein A